MLGFFKGGVANVDLALLAPVFGLDTVSKNKLTDRNKHTVDFQYSAMISASLNYVVLWRNITIMIAVTFGGAGEMSDRD